MQQPVVDPILKSVTLALIAGGMGTRMGQPKAWLQVSGQSVLAWMLDRLQWPGPTMLVTAPAVAPPPDRERFDQFVSDPVDGVGPVRGVLTALEHATTPIVIAMAVDMPYITKNYLAWLAEALQQRSETLGVMGLANVNGESHAEPFPAAYRTAAVPFLSAQLESGQRSLYRLCRDPRFVSLPVPPDWPAETWTNLNDPIQFAAFQNEVENPVREPAV